MKILISNVIPVAVPIPIKDDPAFCMMARTSAKSTLTNPGTCKGEEENRTLNICRLCVSLTCAN
jgi:hypothetical protein